MTPITFFAAGMPVGQPRARVTFQNGKAFGYTPGDRIANWVKSMFLQSLEHRPKTPISEPVSLKLHFYFPLKKDKKNGDLHTIKPDLDNLEKAVMDTLVKAKFLTDDSIVCIKTATKAYGPKPGVRIHIETYDEREQPTVGLFAGFGEF